MVPCLPYKWCLPGNSGNDYIHFVPGVEEDSCDRTRASQRSAMKKVCTSYPGYEEKIAEHGLLGFELA